MLSFERRVFIFIYIPILFLVGVITFNKPVNTYILFSSLVSVICTSYVATTLYTTWYVGKSVFSKQSTMGFSGLDKILTRAIKIRELNKMLLHHQKVISEHLPFPFMVTDDQFNCLIVSKYTIQKFGNNIQGSNITELGFTAPLIGAAKLAMKNDSTVRIPFTKDNDNYYADVFPITWKDTTTHIVFLMRDVSEENKFSALLQEFSVNFGHDMRTPITAIVSAAQTIAQDDLISSKEGKEFLDIILKHSNRLIKLSEDFSRITTVEKASNFSDNIDLVSLIYDAIEDIKTNNLLDEDRIIFEPTSSIPKLTCDKTSFTNTLKELIENALIHSKTTEPIIITCSETIHKSLKPQFVKNNGRAIEISIIDKGKGVSKEEISKLTNEFYKSDPSRTEKKNNFGVGLSFAKKVLNLHNAELSIKSEPNSGSQFIIHLPI